MIAKRIDREPENDNFRNLANYLQNAHHNVGHGRLVEYIEDRQKAYGEEKVLYKWFAGCIADSYDLAIKEVEVTQELNTRVTTGKTYHLMLSFRPEDEVRLTEEVFRDIELEFAKALGFEEYQRHCGVHKNTDNLHIHIAYNMIHPEKLTKHEPFQDFKMLSRTCRAIEQKYGLVVDRGMEKKRETPAHVNQRAQAMEAHSGQQSFDGYARERREVMLRDMAQCASWEDIHRMFAKRGMEYVLRGNGAVLQDLHGHRRIKPSSVARELSRVGLEKRFGPFRASALTQDERTALEQEHYQAVPLQHGSERGELYAEYQRGINYRKTALAEIKTRLEEELATLKTRMERRRNEITRTPGLAKISRAQLLREVAAEEAKKEMALKKQAEIRRAAVKKSVPYWSWTGFLQEKANAGNEVALAILRSKQQLVEPEVPIQAKPVASPSEHMKSRLFRKEIMARTDLLWEDKVKLMAVSRMDEVAAADPMLRGFNWRVDSKGVILFTLPSGGLMRDSPTEILYSPHDPAAQEAAAKLALLKFGKNYIQEGNHFCRGEQQRTERRER